MKLYCVDSLDSATGPTPRLPVEERAREHGRYESWILDQVVPWIHADCGGPQEIATVGVSLGAYHAVNFALKRADLFPLALGLSGNYDPAPGTAGASAATPPTSTTRWTTSRTWTATTWSGCAAG